METFANMKSRFIKVSWGIVRMNDIEVYTELWLATCLMDMKVKFKVPKGMSYSYVCSAKDAPFEDGQFLSYWVPKSMHGVTINELVEIIVNRLQLKFFNESRKWLTQKEKSVAELLAIKATSRKDLGWMLDCNVCDIPQAFWEYAEEYEAGYNAYLNRREREDREMAAKLNTPEGLKYMLRIANRYGGHRPAVSFIKELIFDLTELWDH